MKGIVLSLLFLFTFICSYSQSNVPVGSIKDTITFGNVHVDTVLKLINLINPGGYVLSTDGFGNVLLVPTTSADSSIFVTHTQLNDTIAKVVKYRDSVTIYVTPAMLNDTSLVLRNYIISTIGTVVKYLDSGTIYVTPFMLNDSTSTIRLWVNTNFQPVGQYVYDTTHVYGHPIKIGFPASSTRGLADSITIYQNGKLVFSIDTNNNFYSASKLAIFDKTPTIQPAYDTSKFTVDLGKSNAFIMGGQSAVIGQSNYFSGGSNMFSIGQSNIIRSSSASNRLFQIGTSNILGDSTIDNNSDIQIGRLNSILNVGNHVYFSYQLGTSNIMIPTTASAGVQNQLQIGTSNIDSAKSFRPQATIGFGITNRNRSSFVIGFADSNSTSNTFTTWEDYQMAIISSGAITVSTGAKRRAGKFLRTGQLMLGDDTTQLNGEWLRVPGLIGSDSLKNLLGNTFLLGSDIYGNIIKVHVDTARAGSGFISPSQFGATTNIIRVSNIAFTKGSKRITVTGGNFTNADSGKIFVAKNARTAYWYQAAPMTLEGTIDTIISSTVIAIHYAADTTLSGQSGYYGTNNYNSFYNTSIYCRDNKLKMQFTQPGEYGIWPQFSSIADTQTANNRTCFPMWDNMAIEGTSDNNTVLKYCVEDSVSLAYTNYQYRGFVLMNSGNKSIKNITLLAPDREDFRFYKGLQSTAIWSSLLADSIIGNLVVDHFNVIGDSTGGYKDWDLQWAEGLNHNSPAKKGWFQIDLSNFKFQTGVQGIEVHGDTIAAKGLNQTNYVIQNTGSPLEEQTIASCANISSGANTLTISGQPYFSWYNFRNSTPAFDTTYLITITDGVNTFSDTMHGIISPTGVTLKHNCPYTFSTATLSFRSQENMSGDGHGEYINPGVSTRFINGRYIDNKKLANQFQSSGGINPNAKYRYYDNISVETGPRNLVSRGILMGHAGTTPYTVRNSPAFSVYTQGQPLKIRFYNTYLSNIENAIYDSSYFENCSSPALSFKGTQADTVIGGNYGDIVIAGTATGYVNVYNAYIGQFGNVSASAIGNIYCSKLVVAPTGIGVTNILACSGSIDSVNRHPGNDSVFYWVSGTKHFAFLDSVGTGGGGGSTDTTFLHNRTIASITSIADTISLTTIGGTIFKDTLIEQDPRWGRDSVRFMHFSDTAGLSSRINTKLNITDTAALHNQIVLKLPWADSTDGGFYPYNSNPKGYLSDQSYKVACALATTTALPSNVYSNGSSGVGATLTGVSFGALTVDGRTVTTGQRILVFKESTAANNGIYIVTTVGAVATLYVLTRATDYDQSADIKEGDAVFIEGGATDSLTTWAQINYAPIVIGTGAINFVQIGGAGAFTATQPLQFTGTNIALNYGWGLIVVSNTLIADSTKLETPSAVATSLSSYMLKSDTNANTKAATYNYTNVQLALKQNRADTNTNTNPITFNLANATYMAKGDTNANTKASTYNYVNVQLATKQATVSSGRGVGFVSPSPYLDTTQPYVWTGVDTFNTNIYLRGIAYYKRPPVSAGTTDSMFSWNTTTKAVELRAVPSGSGSAGRGLGLSGSTFYVDTTASLTWKAKQFYTDSFIVKTPTVGTYKFTVDTNGNTKVSGGLFHHPSPDANTSDSIWAYNSSDGKVELLPYPAFSTPTYAAHNTTGGVALTSSYAVIDSVTVTPRSVNSVIQVLVRSTFRADATTARTISMEATNGATVLGKDATFTTTATSRIFAGELTVITIDTPKSTSAQKYYIKAKSTAGSPVDSTTEMLVVDISPQPGPAGATGSAGATGPTGGFTPTAHQVLTDAATVAWNMNSGFNAEVTITASRTLGTPSNLSDGAYGTLVVKENGTGLFELTAPANSKIIGNSFRSGKFPMDTTANAINILSFYYDGTTLYWTCGRSYNTIPWWIILFILPSAYQFRRRKTWV